jgi:hypothetical protein
MKKIRAILILVASSALLTALPADAQPSGWRELLESRVRVAYRYTHPPTTAPCSTGELPPGGFLVTPPHGNAIGRTWLPGATQSTWQPLRGPERPDTLAVRIVALWCGVNGKSVLGESDGYYLEIDGSQLASVDRDGHLAPGILLLQGAAGRPTQGALREECFEETCRLTIVDGEFYAAEVGLAAADRSARASAQMAEADWRATAQAEERLRAGRAVQSQADMVAQRRRAEALQRYGATGAQADAIMAGRVLVGMTPAMVRAALGEPVSTRLAGTGSQSTTVWTYPGREVVFSQGRVELVR